MSNLEPVTIVPLTAITRGRRISKVWWAGWVVAGLAALTSSYMGGQAIAYNRSMKQITEAHREIERLRLEQDKTTQGLVNAWEDQRRGIDLVTSWAQFLKDREDMVAFNKQNKPERLARTR